MMPPPATDETRTRILKEAERLFRHYGYSKTTVADIAVACAMSPANVYRFFASKLEIVEAICDLLISGLEAQLHKIAIAEEPASVRLTQCIELIARHTAETYIQEKKVHDMVVVAMEEHWGAIDRHLNAVEAILASIIASGIEAGEFKPQDPRQAAKIVHFAIVGYGHPVVAAQCSSNRDTPPALDMAAFLLSALKA
jgi:AcrR family transcriptional regulator